MNGPLYICAECGDNEHLEAISVGYMIGPLGVDGQLERYDSAEDTELDEGSIECTAHLGAEVHKLIDGEYHKWENCPECVMGRVPDPYYRTEMRICRRCGGESGRYVPTPSLPSVPSGSCSSTRTTPCQERS